MLSKAHIAIPVLVVLTSCGGNDAPSTPDPKAYTITRTISHKGVSVEAVIDKPALHEVDVLITYHGTNFLDSLILKAAEKTLTYFKDILDNKNMMIVSVAYPEENLLIGDNVKHSEAALLWVRKSAEKELAIKVRRVFLAGHSQGGYIVTRLNTMHQTNGVIANAPGPLDLVYRCQLEENGRVPETPTCRDLSQAHGSTTEAPDAYTERSLLSFTTGFKADILFTQGLDKQKVHMHSWPAFKEKVLGCTDCKGTDFADIPGHGHQALFTSDVAKKAFNAFIDAR